MGKIARLSKCEYQVMHCLWTHSDHEMVLSEIVRDLNEEREKDWNPNTVSTFLSRLASKGYVSSYKKSRYYFYQILIPETEYRMYNIKEQGEDWTDGSIVDLIIRVLENEDLSNAEILRLQEKVAGMTSKKKKK